MPQSRSECSRQERNILPPPLRKWTTVPRFCSPWLSRYTEWAVAAGGYWIWLEHTVWNSKSTLLTGRDCFLTRENIGYMCKLSCMVYHVLNVPHVLSPALFPSRCSTGPLRSWTPTDWHSNTCHFHNLQNRATVLERGREQCSWWLEWDRIVSS